MHTVLHLTVNQLHQTAQNARKQPSSPASDVILSASLQSIGLIQPMVVTARDDGDYDVAAGDRRRRLLTALAEADPSRIGLTFPCMLVEDASQISEISLAENHARENMRPADVYRQFAVIRAERPHATLEDMGAIFGYDPARASRVMRLANLAPEIMDAYAEGGIDDAQAQAYAATEDQSLQVEVYRALEEQANQPHQKNASAIRKAMGVGDRDLTALLRYVGIEAYTKAGGTFEADLFQDPYTGRIENPDILRPLAAERRAEDIDLFEHQLVRSGRKLGEKWGMADLKFSWVDQAPQIKEYGYLSTDRELRIANPKRGTLPKKQEARCREIADRLAALVDEDDEVIEGLEEEAARLNAELDELDAKRTIILPKEGAVVGIASIESDGSFDVELWYASRKDKGLDLPAGAKGVAAIKSEPTPGERERARFGLSKDNMQVMMLIRRDMVRREMINSAEAGSPLVLDFLLFSQARTLLHGTRGYMNNTHNSGEAVGILDMPDDNDGIGKLHDAVKDRPERGIWTDYKAEGKAMGWATAHDPLEGFALFRAEGEKAKTYATALIAGHMLMATTSAYSDGRTPRMVQELANCLESEPGFGRWRDDVEMDEPLFATFSHKARVGLLDQWGVGERAKSMKAAETAAFCARIANCDETDAKLLGIHEDDRGECLGWLPDFMETGTVPPLPVPAIEDDQSDDDELGGDELGDDDDIELVEDEGEMSKAA